MKLLVEVKGKQKWDLKNEDGQQIRGMKIFTNDGEIVSEENREGIFDTTFNCDISHYYTTFSKVPGMYELSLSMKAGSKGQFSVMGAKYVGEVKKPVTI